MSQARALFDQQVLPIFEETRADYLARAREWAVHLGRNGRVVTINDVRRKYPPPAGMDPRVMGAVFHRKLWKVVGYTGSDRRECHGRALSVFKLKEYC